MVKTDMFECKYCYSLIRRIKAFFKCKKENNNRNTYLNELNVSESRTWDDLNVFINTWSLRNHSNHRHWW